MGIVRIKLINRAPTHDWGTVWPWRLVQGFGIALFKDIVIFVLFPVNFSL